MVLQNKYAHFVQSLTYSKRLIKTPDWARNKARTAEVARKDIS
jgi:hypothetical protein